MQERIDCRKLNFLFHLKTLDKSALANEVFELQKKRNYPGLVQECRKMMQKYGLPDIIDRVEQFSKLHWKNIVKKKIRKYSEDKLKSQFDEYSKLLSGSSLFIFDKIKFFVSQGFDTASRYSEEG